MKFWELEFDSDEYNSLTPEQQEFVNFLWKRDYEGGDDSLWGHSGDLHYPERLKPLAHRFGETCDALSNAIERMSKELDIEW